MKWDLNNKLKILFLFQIIELFINQVGLDLYEI